MDGGRDGGLFASIGIGEDRLVGRRYLISTSTVLKMFTCIGVRARILSAEKIFCAKQLTIYKIPPTLHLTHSTLQDIPSNMPSN